jgi:6-phosphogluconolactonase
VPRGFNIDPYGRYLLVAGRASHSMTSYSIDRESGSLNKLKQYPMGKGPNWIEIVRLP